MTNPYLEKLKSKFGLQDIKLDVAELLSARNQALADIAGRLLPVVAGKIARNVEEARENFKGVVLYHSSELNGFVDFFGVDNKDYRINISDGLTQYFHHMTKLWATRVDFLGIHEPKIPLDKVVAFAQSIMTTFWEGASPYGVIKNIPMLEMDRASANFMMHVNFYQLLFLMAHEFGHVVIRFAPQTVQSLVDYGKMQSRSVLQDDIYRLPQFAGFDREDLVRSWGEEFAADMIGVDLALAAPMADIYPELNSDDIAVVGIGILWAVAMLFVMQSMLESFYEKKKGQLPPTYDHPFSTVRLALFRVLCAQNAPDVVKIIDGFRKMGDDILLKC